MLPLVLERLLKWHWQWRPFPDDATQGSSWAQCVLHALLFLATGNCCLLFVTWGNVNFPCLPNGQVGTIFILRWILGDSVGGLDKPRQAKQIRASGAGYRRNFCLLWGGDSKVGILGSSHYVFPSLLYCVEDHQSTVSLVFTYSLVSAWSFRPSNLPL